MSDEPGSVSFDRAAAYYDRTRITDPAVLIETVDLLERELSGRGRVLEVGVGTGALGVPLAERGIDLVGIDLSPAMLAQLRRKSVTLPVVVADATAMPFPADSVGGAYARWVLHLIPEWRRVVDEICRVVASGGVVSIEPGGYRGDWREMWERMELELGPSVRNVGLQVDGDDFGELDAAFARHGARTRASVTFVDVRSDETLSAFFQQARERSFSWTWRVDEAALRRAVDAVEAWARERYGDLDAVGSRMQMRWRTYDLP